MTQAIKPFRRVSQAAAAWAASGCLVVTALAQPTDYLSDRPELLVQTQQAWGTLGYDVAAHAADKPGLPIQIGAQRFAKGLGHHANGTIQVLLDGEFDRFEAQVGVQPCDGGSVVFRVLVDGTLRFESGVMKSGDPAKPVVVAVAGAQELVLDAKDAGDGISCDMANWAEARLHRAAQPPPRANDTAVDIAPFGRVVTWDANRTTGTRATRIEEFPAEDLFLETDLRPVAYDQFSVPNGTNRLACIGLQWLNRRAIRELRLEFVDAARVPDTNRVRVEGWFGESAWQGEWKPLLGEFAIEGSRLTFRASPKSPTGGLLLTRKVRWVWPATTDRVLVKHPLAFTRSRWTATTIRFESDKGHYDDVLEVRLENGTWLNPQGTFVANDRLGQVGGLRIRPGSSLVTTVRSSLPSSFRSDPTLLQLRLNQAGAAVAIEDVLDQGSVYLPEFGVLISRADRPIKLATYKKQIAGRKTILDQVRALPDQTLEQAMAKTHHEAQREGPVMLSLACDNHKVVVERDGTVRFSNAPALSPDWLGTADQLRPEFGPGASRKLSRRLDGDWLPIPVITVEQTNLVWRQRTFVAPVTAAAPEPAKLYTPRSSVCVVEFSVTNTAAEPTEARLNLRLQLDPPSRMAANLTRCARGYFILKDTALIGRALTDAADPLTAAPRDGVLDVRGTLAPGQGAAFAVLLPSDANDLLKLPAVTELRAQTEAYWNSILAPATQIETPDAFLNHLIRSSQVRCLIAARNEADGERIAPWIAAMSYGPLESEAHAVVRGMDFLGHTEFARRGLDYFIHRYNTKGFLTTGYTTFGTAWHLWTLGEHYQLSRDTEWLDQVSPELKRVGRWITRQTEKTRRHGPDGTSPVPGFGLMPPGVMADWNAFAYHFCLDAYYTAALRGLGDALSDRGDREGQYFREAAGHLEGATASGWLRAAAQSPAVPLRNGTWVRYYPSQVHSPGKLGGFFPGEDAGRSWCYDVELGAHQLVPTGVLPWLNHRVTEMLEHMEDVQFLADGWFDYPATLNEQDWFNLGGFSKVQPYYTRNCEIYALRGDVKPFIRSYFNTLAAMVNPEVLTMWEHFQHSGAWDKTHETGYFLHQTRTMLVTEQGDRLQLAPFITSNWLKDGSVVKVSNAPTRFGPVSFRLESHVAQNRITATIDPPTRQAPESIVLKVRHPEGRKIRSVLVNGKSHRDFSREPGTVTLPSSPGPIRVEVRY